MIARRMWRVLVAATAALLAGALTGTVSEVSTPAPAAAYPLGEGYWLAAADGGMFSFGDAQFFGSTGDLVLNKPIVGMASHPFLEGYWLVASDGGVFTFGTSGFFGSTGNLTLDEPIVGMASTPTGDGYWLVASDGGVFSFGDAEFLGSMGGKPLNRPIVGMAPTPSGDGYWLVATDGGIFAFGDAKFFGSQGGAPLNRPVVGMASTPSGQGYYLVASDGGLFTHGDAVFRGSRGGEHLNSPVVGMALSRTGNGYQLVATDGGIFNYGDSKFFGSTGNIKLNKPVLGMAIRPAFAVKVDAYGTGDSQSSTWTSVDGDWRLRLDDTVAGGTPAGARVLGPEGLDVSQLGAIGFTVDAGACTGATVVSLVYDTDNDRKGDAEKVLSCDAGTSFSADPVAAGVPGSAKVVSLDITHTGAAIDLDDITVAGLTVGDFQVVRAA